MTSATLRIDSRLVHGQVVETWLPALKASSVVVIDETTAGSRLARAAMRLALPPDIALTIIDPSEANPSILRTGRSVLLLVPTVEVAVSTLEKLGVPLKELIINVGMVHQSPGRRPITTGIHLSEVELEMLARVAERGFSVEFRGLPSHTPLAVEDARERFDKQASRAPDST